METFIANIKFHVVIRKLKSFCGSKKLVVDFLPEGFRTSARYPENYILRHGPVAVGSAAGWPATLPLLVLEELHPGESAVGQHDDTTIYWAGLLTHIKS